MAETFPFYLPISARRLFTSEGVMRRIAQTAHWTNTARVLELYGSNAGLSLAKDLGCEVTLADGDDHSLKVLHDRAKVAGLSPRVTISKVNLDASGQLPFSEGTFDGVLALGRLVMPLDQAATRLRKYLG